MDIDQPTNPTQLYDLFARLGFRIATRAVMPDMDAPFDAFCAAFFDWYDTLMLEGARGTGKSRGVSLVMQAKAQFRPGYNIAHIGAVKAQAYRVYQYLREYVDKGGVLAPLVWRTRLSDTQYRNASHIEILAGTTNAVSGGHPHMMSIDEFDMMPWPVYQQAVGMPQSDDRYNSQTVLLSALYRSQGTLNAVKTSNANVRVFRWSVFDAMEPCDGQHNRPSCEDAIAVWNHGPVSNPPRCPLWNDCRGRAILANGHKKRRDVLQEFFATDDFTWRTQYLSEDAQRAGVVYEHYRDDPSDEGETNVSTRAEYDPALEVDWALDAGYEDPNVCLFIQQAGDEIHVFDEVYVKHTATDQFLEMCGQLEGLDGKGPTSWYRRVPGEEPRGPYKRPRRGYPDINAKELGIQLGRLIGSTRIVTRAQRVLDGIAVVRRLIKNNAGIRRLVIHPRCVNLRRELTFLRLEQLSPGVWGDMPAKNDDGMNPDHAADPLRYYSWIRFGRAQPGRASVTSAAIDAAMARR